MRDALTLLDKCLSYNNALTIENVIKALGTVNYNIMFKLTDSILFKESGNVITIINDLYLSGIDLKQFVKSYMQFVLDINKYILTSNFEYITIPGNYMGYIEEYKGEVMQNSLFNLLETLIKLNTDIKWESSPKALIEATLLLRCV